jgi:hypothetical protein
MHRGEKSKPTKSTVELAREAGMTDAELQRFKSTLAATVFTLKLPEKVYLRDREVDLPPVKEPMREAIARAFEHFKLDAEDPQSWAQVVSYFAFVFFLGPQPEAWSSSKTRCGGSQAGGGRSRVAGAVEY